MRIDMFHPRVLGQGQIPSVPQGVCRMPLQRANSPYSIHWEPSAKPLKICAGCCGKARRVCAAGADLVNLYRSWRLCRGPIAVSAIQTRRASEGDAAKATASRSFCLRGRLAEARLFRKSRASWGQKASGRALTCPKGSLLAYFSLSEDNGWKSGRRSTCAGAIASACGRGITAAKPCSATIRPPWPGIGWPQGHQCLHLVDLDGARDGRSVNREAIEAIVRGGGRPVRVGRRHPRRGDDPPAAGPGPDAAGDRHPGPEGARLVPPDVPPVSRPAGAGHRRPRRPRGHRRAGWRPATWRRRNWPGSSPASRSPRSSIPTSPPTA